ncbi:MAG: DUF4886 domain-containing protein [Eubacteriales bacterium]|nr:DUF4886 domain-containing protein [Eubacteriales bacterium]
MKAWKRILLLGMVFCIVLTVSGFAMAADVSIADDTEEIVIDSGEEAEETAPEQTEEEPTEESEQETAQEIRIQDISASSAAQKPVVTQSTEVASDKTLRILAIGNSFTNDTMRYVAHIASSAGYNVTVGVLWKSSSSLEDHLEYITNNSSQYTYDKFSKASGYDMVSHSNTAPNAAFADEKWDLVFLQQVSYLNGDPQSILDADGNSYITQLTEIIRKKISNSGLSFAWLMGWAYAQDYESTYFARYNNNQMTMYNAIADTARETVWASGTLDSIIPVGTAIQNVRSSYIGDNLNRDGKHLTYSMGRYVAGLTVAASIGVNINKVTYLPTGSTVVSSLHKPMLVEAARNAIESPFQRVVSSYTKQPSRTTPTIQEITNSSTGATLKWKSCSGVSYYRVYRKTSSGSWKTLKSSTTSVSYKDTTASNGTKYIYKVLAHFDSNLDSKTSAQVTSRWLSAPTITKAAANSTSAITLTWKTNSQATGYRIRYSTSQKMTNAKTVTVSKGKQKKITGLKSGKTYYFQVRARKSADSSVYSSAWSGVVSAKTASNTPSVPSSLKTSKGKKAVSLTWKASSKATGYQIRYSTSKKMTSAKTITVKKVTAKKITGLKSGKTYYFQIRARNKVGAKTYSSSWSDIVSGKTS